jgi:hypothetical protein
MANDLSIPMEHAQIKEAKLEEANINEIRVYHCGQKSFTFQIRTHKPITQWGAGTARDMYATVTIDIKTMKKIMAYMEKQVKA